MQDHAASPRPGRCRLAAPVVAVTLAVLLTGCSRGADRPAPTVPPSLAPAQVSTTVSPRPVAPPLQELNVACARLQPRWFSALGTYRDEKLARAQADSTGWLDDASFAVQQLRRTLSRTVVPGELRGQLDDAVSAAGSRLERAARRAEGQPRAAASQGLEALRLLEVAMSAAGAPACAP